MDHMIEKIYELTVKMNKAIENETYEDLEKLLDDRKTMMMQVDTLIGGQQEYQYSPKAKCLLEETLRLDQLIAPQLKSSLEIIGTTLQQIKIKKQISKKFQPYMKQTNGAFIDTNK